MKHTQVRSETDGSFLQKPKEPLAHITEDGRTHTLREHLFKTAEPAADFASVFGFSQWGRLSGLWHDLGKYAQAFQNKLEAAAGDEAHIEAKARVNHSTTGGLYAVERFGMRGRSMSRGT